jgi:DNA-binding NtrC family response regulator
MASRKETPAPARAPERFAIAARGERLLEFLELEHEVLAPAASVSREGGDLVLWREAVGGRSIADGPVPRTFAAALVLQAAAAGAFFASRGFGLAPRDLDAALWDAAGGEARLWLARAPEAVADPPATQVPVVGALRPFLDRLFARGGRLGPGPARDLANQLDSADAATRRPEFWVAAILRGFPELAGPGAAGARRRCLGVSGPALRSGRARASLEAARALVRGGRPRLFEVDGSALAPGSALRSGAPPVSASEASRRLRAEAEDAGPGSRPVWIAIAPEGWDSLSRAAFDAAALALGERVAVVSVPREAPRPEGPEGWRRAVWVPCGTLAASVRFYEWISGLAGAPGAGGRERAADFLASSGFARFAADPTGDAPLPLAPRQAPAPARASAGPAPDDPGRRIELALGSGDRDAALGEARRWIASLPGVRPEAWFSLSALLAAHLGQRQVAWVELLEAEREIAGGRPADARSRLERIARRGEATDDERRRAKLRAAEVAVMLGEAVAAAGRAAGWRREHPDAPPDEDVRALRLGAAGLAREGRSDCALALLDEADRIGACLPDAERLSSGIARAQVFALAGRFDEEAAVYAALRPAVAAAGDEALAARFLAQEARGLLDRREYGRAALRLEEAIGAASDDPAERAALAIDLAATRYHAGDRAGSEAALDEARASAAAAGREDLARLARGNRIELLVDRCAFAEADSEIAAAEQSARRDRDDRRLAVALHQRSRLALRRGDFGAASRDNAAARRLAESLHDRLEIGELWLEDGDRAACEGDRDGARSAWERAAADPPDRCDSDRIARRRLAELAWDRSAGPPPEAAAEIEELFDTDAFRAAETVARWSGLFGPESVGAALRERAALVLRAAGAAPLADLAAGSAEWSRDDGALRALRAAVAGTLAGDGAGTGRALAGLGLGALAVREAGGRELVRLSSTRAAPADGEHWRPLEAGAVRLELALAPEVPERTAASVALMLETLFYRSATDGARVSDAAQGWKRLGLVTADAAMEEPYRRLARFAPQPVTVLILGESGSGKEAVARAVHRLSPRAAGPFVPVNVPAIPPALAESELFGHARGAFTGADRERRGLVEEAGGGTLFLDEIGDLAAPLQSKLLRALQEREVRRVGENRARPVDVRVVSATSRDLAREVEAGRFREDLFYRLHVAVIRIPALRERGRDAVLLAGHFLERYAREYGRGALRLSAEAAAALARYPWPGNVRELQNAMAQAAALGDGLIGLELLPEPVRGAREARPAAGGDYRSRVDAHRRDLIADALDRTGGNRSRAARELGLSRQALLYLIRELKVPVKAAR